MNNILITGGAGFIGSNFVAYWIDKYPSDKVIVLDKLTYAGNPENLINFKDKTNFSFIKGDISNFDLVDSLFRDNNINIVINFAAESHVDRSILGPEIFIDTNIKGTFTLLEAAKKNWGTSCAENNKCFLHVSTDEVYGSLGEVGYFTEDTQYKPNSPYSATKAASDHLVRAYFHTYGIPVITTNCSNNYGPYQFPEKLLPLIIINSLTGKPLPVYGDGQNIRDWLYVKDHCSAIDLALKKGKPGETYNIGGKNEWRNLDIINLICDIIDELVSLDADLSKEFPFKDSRKKLITFVKDRPGHDRRYAIDCSKIEKEIGWTPKTNFESGLRDTIKWYITHQSWWRNILSGVYKN